VSSGEVATDRTRPARPDQTRRGRVLRTQRIALGAVAATLVLSGCSGADARRLGFPRGITTDSDRVTSLWQGAWTAAFIVGGIVWGLIIWAIVAYRRRGNEMPAQTRYNMPIEALYTILPVVIVAVLFFYTVRDQSVVLKKDPTPDAHVKVIGYKFAWTFGYSDPQNRFQPVYDTGTNETLPELWVPQGESMEYTLISNDVIHAFWVPAFLFKMDVVPGRENTFYKTATTTGSYAGRCSELCGINHSHMLFTVRVVTPEQYLAHMADLRRRGQVGDPQGHLSQEYNPNRNIAEGQASQ